MAVLRAALALLALLQGLGWLADAQSNEAGISIGSCSQLLTVTEQLSLSVSHLQRKIRNRACLPGLVEDRATGVCGISGCTNHLYQEFNENATTQDGCANSTTGCCRVLNCVADGTCLPPGADNLDGVPGDCADDAPDLVAGGLISFYQASLNRACSDLVEDIGSLGHWAEENITFRDNVGLQDDHSVSTGRSVHAMDGSHKTFGCNSTLARFMQLLDQSGQRECYDHEVLTSTMTGYSCAEVHSLLLESDRDCSTVVQELPNHFVAHDFRPEPEFPAQQFAHWCPVTCGNCGRNVSYVEFQPEVGTYSATSRPFEPDALDLPRDIRTGTVRFSYDYEWVVPTDFDTESILLKDICPVTCNNCRGA